VPHVVQELVSLSRAIASPAEDCVILGEGNTSALLDDGTFLVKASGFSLADIRPEGFVRVSGSIAEHLDGLEIPDDDQVRQALFEARVDPSSDLMPSTETFMHAYLLSLPGVRFVAHTHPSPLVSLLATEACVEIAAQRLFPDEIVCCGPKSCLAAYGDPGLELARRIRDAVNEYVEELGEIPKTIWIRNHGLICLGATSAEALTATRMSVKAARVWLGALATGRTIVPLNPKQVERIHRRPDEHYRQRLLWKINPPRLQTPSPEAGSSDLG
jgi:L-ribulose-5-phosphate 4-epimerase